MAVAASQDLVSYTPLTLLVPHTVSHILLKQNTSLLKPTWYLRYHTWLVAMPDITVERCTALNPVSLLPLPEDSQPHDSVAALNTICSPRSGPLTCR